MSEEAASDVARSFHVAVIGGGISGLSTAWYVQKEALAQGIAVVCTVYETSPRWGGRIRTDLVERDEGRFVVEGGPDSFLTAQKPWATSLALELGLGGRLLGTNDAARKVYVLSKGRPVRLPEGVFLLVPTKFKPFLLSPLISPLGKLRMGLDLFIPPRRDSADEALGDFVSRRLGSEAMDKIAEPLMSGIYNAEVERQSLLATFPRFRETELAHGSLIRGMLADQAEARGRKRENSRKQVRGGADAKGPVGVDSAGGAGADAAARDRRPAHAGPSSVFVSFVAGTEEIITALTERLGARLRAGVRVESVRLGIGGDYLLDLSGGQAGTPVAERRAQVAAADAIRAGGTDTIHADAVVLAIPAYDAAGLLASLCPAAAGILRTVRYVSTGTMSLGYRRDLCSERLGGFGVLVPRSERRPLNAVTWSSTKFDHRAPEGCSLLRVFFGGSRSPGSMQLDDDELLSVVKKELRSIMGVDKPPLFHRVYRWEMANAQYDVEHLRRVEAVERALPPGVWVTGSPYRGVGLPDCVHQGQITAAQVVERLKALQRSTL